MKILIIEDDIATAELENDYLRTDGYECDIAVSGIQGLEMALKNDYVLVILDIMLPGCDGFTVCKEIRASKDIPIIFVSAKNSDIDKIRGLRLGADDYVTKPFSPAELAARVTAHINRYEKLVAKQPIKNTNILLARGLKIDKNARRIYVDGKEVPMPVKEFELLLFLAENPNIVFSKERLFDRIWGIDAMSDMSTVTVHIQRIRNKIDNNKLNINHIETVWGAGYRFRL